MTAVMKSKWKLQSQGTQPKWHDLSNDNFYKADDVVNFGGCEGLAETICSDILDKSNIGYHATYRLARVRSGFHTYVGCESPNFRKPNDRLVTAVDFTSAFDYDPESLRKDHSTKEIMEWFLQIIHEKTGGYDMKEHLCKMLEFDQLVLNTDRNLGNIDLLIQNDGTILPVLFDNGRSFATNLLLQRPELSAEEIADTALSLPFSKTYPLQVNAIRTICDVDSLFRTSYTKDDLCASLAKCREFYPSDLIERTRHLVEYQMDRYPMYFLTPERERLCKDFSALVYEFSGSAFAILPSNGDLLFRNTEDPSIQYRFSVCTKKLTCLVDHEVTPMTPPKGLPPEREKETEKFLLAIRTGCSELSLEQERTEELER